MISPASTFLIVYQPQQQGPSQALGGSADANAATVIAHQHLERLRQQGRSGEVQVVRVGAEPTIVLRLPLVHRPTRRLLAARRAPAVEAVRLHPGWAAKPSATV